MSNVKFDTDNQYYSGQGVLLLGVLHPTTFAFLGYEQAGNVADVKIQIATSNIEHKGSQDGQRAIDLRLPTATNVKLMFTMESWKPSNIARALRGAFNKLAATTGAAASFAILPGLLTSLGKIKVANVVVTQTAGSAVLTDYSVAGAAWDYKVNADGGSIQLNDGSVESISVIGTVPSAVAIGATTSITVTHSAAVGESVTLAGFTGADAALLNGQRVTVATVTGTTALTVAINTTGKTITTAAGTRLLQLNATVPCTVAFDYAASYQIDALTKVLKSLPMRFEGLNTADGLNPVTIDVWKFSSDPLKELSMISDTVGQMAIEGTVLSDATKTTGSKYFQVSKLNS